MAVGLEDRDEKFEAFDDVVGVVDCELLGREVRFIFT